ncbi:CBN-ZTF-9 protein [Aphelenchoides avenae]|nr:CBN-ZTF-9 protein [Aphelenchus avenae]
MPTCFVCQEFLTTRQELEVHLAAEHVHYLAYECEHCKHARFPTDYALRQHYEEDHQLKTFYVRYRVTPDLEKKREELEYLVQSSLSQPEQAAGPSKTVANAERTTMHHAELQHHARSSPRGVRVEAQSGMHPTQSHAESRNEQCEALGQYPNAGQSDSDVKPELIEEQDILLARSSASESPAASNGEDETGLDEIDRSAALLEAVFGKDRLINSGILDSVYGDSGSPGPDRRRFTHQIPCGECGRQVSNYVNSLVLHVSTHHCKEPIYECRGCGKQWFSLSARYKEHIRNRHNDDMSLLKDNRRTVMPSLKKKTMVLFKDHHFSSSYAPLSPPSQ